MAICCLFMWALSLVNAVLIYVYECIEVVINYLYSPLPPKQPGNKFGHVAIIGAGLSGISSASQLISQGFEVTIFEEHDETGGIWARVNESSGLQINSIMYRFHPLVYWTKWYPHRDQILWNIRRIWQVYSLKQRTRFGTPVTKVERHSSSTKLEGSSGQSRWVINGNQSEVFDAVVVTIGTCGKPKFVKTPGESDFAGKVLHSSQLDQVDFKGKKVIVIGGGASGVEAAELAAKKGAIKPTILARSDKWLIPRNIFVDCLLAMQPFGREMPLSFIPEWFIRKFHYRELVDKMAPTEGFYIGTPIVNNEMLQLVRSGRADYHRGDVKRITKDGVIWNARKRGQKKGAKGEEKFSEADIIVLATGFQRPTFDFLPDDLFPEDYTRPNMYLQVFPVTDWSVLCTNSTFHNAVGTVGHVHIGMYARILALFLNDPNSRPAPKDMRLWVDLIRHVKENAPGGELEFFTYMELCLWFALFLCSRLRRIRYVAFILCGYGRWLENPNSGSPHFQLTITTALQHLRHGFTLNERSGRAIKN
ncbi:hypothetical protein MVES1_001525 [Malassezia vespertilionis]|uniref:FAD/NAD(P)-binding domain-containing protein n=1 Tax=Malassezia vespertilionis TaxID=2020962 RepID=A0A2N1JD46_9BASI|nr:uncharacterized protein MVES1_001525 [Malassezia vespertilionis]PKI84466.1 hypothetical protein MVES_001438 [Malassezia vespertilionis]WFD06183.1 hypothetical protein MVES1_001525 [Malassezia vespertilionis]